MQQEGDVQKRELVAVTHICVCAYVYINIYIFIFRELNDFKTTCLPPVVSCEHLQTHLSLSASFVLKSFPGWERLLILPAVPL